MHSEPEEVLTAEATAARLGVARSTVQVWGRRGRIPRLRIGRKVIRYSWEAVLDAIRSRGVCARCGVPLDCESVAGFDEGERPYCRGCLSRGRSATRRP